VSEIESSIGRSLSITHSYSITLNGIAADMTADEAARIATIPGVKEVKRAGFEKLATFRGPKFIGADKIWDGSATPGDVGTRGQGIVVGDLDGGTNHDHPSFADDGVCGFDSTHHKLTAVDCSASSGGQCTGSNPEANPGFGHGVHTSSTAAGPEARAGHTSHSPVTTSTSPSSGTRAIRRSSCWIGDLTPTATARGSGIPTKQSRRSFSCW